MSQLRTSAAGAVIVACWAILVPVADLRAELALHDGDVVVFVGDQMLDTPNPQRDISFGVLAETFLTVRYPALRVQYHHRGWTDDTAERLSLRLQRDVLSLKPTVVVICLGINDPQYHAYGEKAELLEKYKESLGQVVQRCREAGARVWLVSPPCVYEQRGSTARIMRDGKHLLVDLAALEYNRTLADYAAAMQEIAASRRAEYVDWFTPMNALLRRLAADDNDLVAPNHPLKPLARAHALAATLLLQAWGAQPIEAVIQIDWPQGKASTSAGDGTAQPADVIVHEDGTRRVAIRALPLPWPMPGDRLSALQPRWAAADFCRIILRASSVPAHGLRLSRETRDGIARGDLELTADEMRAGVNLAAADPLRSAEEVRGLLQRVGRKNAYRYAAWRRSLEPPTELELVEPQRLLVDAWEAFARGEEAVIARMPKSMDLTLVVTENKPQEQIPTTRPVRSPGSATRPRPPRLEAPPRQPAPAVDEPPNE